LGGVGGQSKYVDGSAQFKDTPIVKFSLPRGANLFRLYGTVGAAYGNYAVRLDPSPPFKRTWETFNATRAYISMNQLFYNTPLDPAEQYNVTITGDPIRSKILGLRRYEFCYFDPA
jgi:hypothetical protein